MESGLLSVSPYVEDARSLAQMLDDASLNVVHVRGQEIHAKCESRAASPESALWM